MSATYPSLAGAPVFITGGASGIGAALVEAFADQGSRVAFIDRDAAAAEALLARLDAPLDFTPVDVADVDALQAAVGDAAVRLGGLRVLVNNVGWDERHALDTVDAAFWDASMAVNLRSHFFAAQAALPALAEGGGSIINLSSNSFLLGVPGMPAYLTAKAGIVGMTRALARELGPRGIRVNTVLPGWVMTERQRTRWLTEEAEAKLLAEQCLKRTIEPRDVADLVLFLGSDSSAMITKQSLVVDGGRS